MTTQKEEFITKARCIHNNRYNYDNVEYVTGRTKVSINCPEHGEFLQNPYSHVYLKCGCPKCAVEARNKSLSSTVEKFIEKANAIHGVRYNYTKVVYVNNSTRVVIICTEHGEFLQTPNSHLLGRGCPHCGGKVKLSTEEFIAKAKATHGERYDYSEVDYVSAKTPVKIICKTHGPFEQIPNNHTQGAGCYFCVERVIANTQEFIERAKEIHGERYDYSKVNYQNVASKITLGCCNHGYFDQIAGEHLRGKGCRYCRDGYSGKINTLTTQDFISNAKKVHGDKYDYTKVVYTQTLIPVKIICKIHGLFQQRPTNHLRGHGCVVCSASKGELAIADILNKIGLTFVKEYNIPYQNNKFRYDFYVPELNLLIEYHGQQHYTPVDFFGGEEGLKATKIRDAMKKTLAKIYGYKLIEVNYTQFLNLSREDFERKLIANLKLKNK